MKFSSPDPHVGQCEVLPPKSEKASQEGDGPTVSFQILETTPADRKRRWFSLGSGSILQALLVFVLVRFGIMLGPTFTENPREHQYIYLTLTSPAPKPAAPVRIKLAPRVAFMRIPILAAPKLPSPPRLATSPSRPLPEPPRVEVKNPPAPDPVFASAVTRTPPAKRIDTVRTDVFEGSSAEATVSAPARKVQTGGFGSPNGMPGEALGGHPGNVAKLGSFDLPQGPGNGNGTGGARGVRGTVASAGFGNGYAVSPADGSQGVTSRGAVKSGGFDDARPVAPTPEVRPQVKEPALEPMEILAKPNPNYSEEARRMKIQGEVVLGVVFEATGKVRVVRVLQGLGHGLDEEALRAAEQIRFRPARRGNRPVDFPATVRIIFQLAA